MNGTEKHALLSVLLPAVAIDVVTCKTHLPMNGRSLLRHIVKQDKHITYATLSSNRYHLEKNPASRRCVSLHRAFFKVPWMLLRHVLRYTSSGQDGASITREPIYRVCFGADGWSATVSISDHVPEYETDAQRSLVSDFFSQWEISYTGRGVISDDAAVRRPLGDNSKHECAHDVIDGLTARERRRTRSERPREYSRKHLLWKYLNRVCCEFGIPTFVQPGWKYTNYAYTWYVCLICFVFSFGGQRVEKCPGTTKREVGTATSASCGSCALPATSTSSDVVTIATLRDDLSQCTLKKQMLEEIIAIHQAPGMMNTDAKCQQETSHGNQEEHKDEL